MVASPHQLAIVNQGSVKRQGRRATGTLFAVPPIPDPPEQMYAFVTEEALGVPVSDRAALIACVEELPLELAMILVSRIQGELVHIRTDAQAQLNLAALLLEDVDIVNAIAAFLNGGPRRVVFSEQNLTALQRLLVLHGRDDAGLETMARADIEGAKRALLAVPSAVEPPRHACVTPPNWTKTQRGPTRCRAVPTTTPSRRSTVCARLPAVRGDLQRDPRSR